MRGGPLVIMIQGTPAGGDGSIVNNGTVLGGDFFTNTIRKCGDFFPVKVPLQTMSNGLMEKNPGPPWTQHHIHLTSRGILGLKIQKRLSHRFACVPLIILLLSEKRKTHPSSPAKTPHLPISPILCDTGHIESDERLYISHNPTV